PLHESTQQVENLRPDTACGLQAEKTGRFSLHRRDNTRPDKRSASGIFASVIGFRLKESAFFRNH
ncbi:hypothetical protein ACVD1Y_22255, partial [Escherichia coli]